MIRIKIVSIFILSIAFLILGCASDEEKKQAHFAKGNAYFEEGEFKSARLEFKNAIQIDPKYKEDIRKLMRSWAKPI